jgi:hypothetical protein
MTEDKYLYKETNNCAGFVLLLRPLRAKRKLHVYNNKLIGIIFGSIRIEINRQFRILETRSFVVLLGHLVSLEQCSQAGYDRPNM